MENSTSIFKKFETGDIVAGRNQVYSFGIWENNNINQTTFFTSSQAVNTGSNNYGIGNGEYYWDIYDKSSPDTTPAADKYFTLCYGHIEGLNSSNIDKGTSKFFPSKANYTQYKNLLLSPETAKFSVLTEAEKSVEIDDFYALNFSTEKYKDRLDSGQFEISIKGPTGTVTLIDDSLYSGNSSGRNKGVFNLISGSLSSGPAFSSLGNIYNGYGLIYPNNGVVLINPSAIRNGTGLPAPVYEYTGSMKAFPNQDILLTGGRLSGLTNQNGLGIINIVARGTEFIPSRHYFVRVKNNEFNYSNNPTFVKTGSEAGQLKFEEFYEDPKVYITTVGLYNETNDLIAVAKLSKPLLKTFDSEALIKIALSW